MKWWVWSLVLIGSLLSFNSAVKAVGAIDSFRCNAAYFSSLFSSTYQFKVLGSHDVSPELMHEAREVLRHLKVPNASTIAVKQMSPLAQEVYGESAIATHNALFINHEWFKELDSEQRKFALAHEATHLKNNDLSQGIKTYISAFLFGQFALAMGTEKTSSYAIGCIIKLFVVQVLFNHYHRQREYSADKNAANHYGTESGINLYDQLGQDDLEEEEPSVFQKIIRFLFSKYPTFQERVAYLNQPEQE